MALFQQLRQWRQQEVAIAIQGLRRSQHQPGGPVRLDPKTQHTTKFCRIGRIRRDRQFDLIWESPEPIAPDPYPELAFPGWKCDWTAGGITRGAEVSIDGDL